MQSICSKGVCINVPDVRSATRRDFQAENNAFLQSFPPELAAQLTNAMAGSTIPAIGESFVIALDAYSLTFQTFESRLSVDEYLLGFLQSMSREPVDADILSDCMLGPLAGRKYGQFAEGWSAVGWMARSGELLVDLSFQGPGVPPSEIQCEIEAILGSLQVADSAG